MLDITPCSDPEPALFAALLQHKLRTQDNPPQSLQSSTVTPDCPCFLLASGMTTRLIVAHPSSGERALTAALQTLQQHALPDNTELVLLSATPPPALDWLTRQHSLHWCRCQLLKVNDEHGLLIEDPDQRLQTDSSPVAHSRLLREPAPGTAHEDHLTEEERRFFSHL